MNKTHNQIETLTSEIQILQKKLESKSKAFSIVINELESLKQERDQFKSLADSLQEKSMQLKRQLNSKIETLGTLRSSSSTFDFGNDSTIQMLKTALKTVQDEKEILQSRVEELTQELDDTKGDLSIFRQKRYRNRLTSDPSIDSAQPKSTHQQAEENLLVEHLEKSNEKIQQLENDLKLIVCQKEELEIERDSFKTKYSKLNQELNKILNGNEKRPIDIEILLSENRYLKEKIKELTDEKNVALSSATKYKELLQTNRPAATNLGKIQSTGNVLTQKQVRNLLNQSYLVPNTAEVEQDLRSIAEALLENLKDKNVTINHQRKTNKILANRVNELEKLLGESKIKSNDEEKNVLVNLIDQNATSKFVNSFDQVDPTSPTQIFSFSSNWPSTQRTTDDENKSTDDRRRSRKTSHRSEPIDLEMDDPLHSPNLSSPLAYLEERDVIPPNLTNDDEDPTRNLNC